MYAFRIEYSFENEHELYSAPEYRKAREDRLRYDFFCGDVCLKAADKQICANWSWVPLLDFALCMLSIWTQLKIEENITREFDFTESPEKISFERNGDLVIVKSSFSDDILQVVFDEFERGVRQFYKSLVRDIAARFKGIDENEVFIRFYNEVDNLEGQSRRRL